MKWLLLLCVGIIYSDSFSATLSDSTSYKKQHKNLIEIGYSAAWFFDKHPMAFYKEGGLDLIPVMSLPSWMPSYIKYSRIIHKQIDLGLSNYSFAESYIPFQKGDIWIRSVNDVTISIGRSFFRNLNQFTNLKYSFSPGVSYRWGTEWVYLAENDYHDVIYTCMCDYNSIGLGSTGSIDFVLKKRLYFGGSAGYTYYFEKSKMNPNSPYYFKAYRPNRDVFVFHPRLGVMF